VDAIAAYRSSGSEGLTPCLQLLQQAARDKSVKPELVEGALAYLEQNHGGSSTCSSSNDNSSSSKASLIEWIVVACIMPTVD
jgi:hypothetical protein